MSINLVFNKYYEKYYAEYMYNGNEYVDLSCLISIRVLKIRVFMFRCTIFS